MNKNQVTRTKRGYVNPVTAVFKMEATTQIMKTSFPSQHNPGHHGTGPTPNAKQGVFTDEEYEEDDNMPYSLNSWDK